MQAPGSRLTIAGPGTGKGKTNILAYRVTHLILTGTVHFAADFHPSRRRRGKSGKDSRVSNPPFRSAAPFSGGSGKFVRKDGHFV